MCSVESLFCSWPFLALVLLAVVLIAVDGFTLRRIRRKEEAAPVESNPPSGDREFSFGPCKTISIDGSWSVVLQCNAEKNLCRISGEPELLAAMKIEESHGTLLVRGNGKGGARLPTLEISTAGLPETVKSAGANTLVILGAAGGELCCKITALGSLEMPDAALEAFTLKIAGACKAKCSGKFGAAEVECSGASSVKFGGTAETFKARLSGASKLEVAHTESAEVDVSGASTLKIEATRKLEGDVSGASSVKYRGGVNPDIRVSGLSKLKTW